MSTDDEFLGPGACIDSDAPAIAGLAARLVDSAASPRAAAVRLYYHVRDTVRYNPYAVNLSVEGLRASTTLAAGQGWCVPKAVLLAALCRAVGIPARLGFADVVNHLSTQRMREAMQTDVFYFHGYCSLQIDGRWVKATPAFNRSLCERFDLLPLEFDGSEDSLYHPFDRHGQRHMEYVNERGEYADVPLAAMREVFSREYPGLARLQRGAGDAERWDEDVQAESGRAGRS
jgi:transglutaminase-like putative cysteine protease